MPGCINAWISPEMIPFACGRCISCKLDKQKTTITRILLEATQHSANGFASLTYDDEHLPENGTLVPMHSRNWLKRYREAIDREWPGKTIRYVQAAEYGGKTERPHYHFVLFGLRCEHGYRIRTASGGWECHCRPCVLLRKTWTSGFCHLDEFTPAAARYIAKYCVKKISDPDDPRLHGRHPEFMTRSNRPGIAAGAIPAMAVQFMRCEELLNARDRSYQDVPNGCPQGPFDNYTMRKLRVACGRPPGAPDEIRAKGLVRNYPLGLQAWKLATTPGARIPLKMAMKRVIHDANIQGALNKQARANFALGRRK